MSIRELGFALGVVIAFAVVARTDAGPSPLPRTVDRVAPSNAYRGRVVDERGAPVALAEVVLGVDCAYGSWFGPLPRRVPELERTASTNADGRFEVAGLEARDCYSLRVRHPDFAILDTQTSAVGLFGVFEPNEPFVLLRGARLSGFVRDEEGEPIAGARLQLDGVSYAGDVDPAPDRAETKSTRNGSFAFEHAARGSRTLTVSAPGFATREVDVRDLVDGQPRALDVVLPVQAFLLGVVREPSGAPIAGAQVIAISSADARPRMARSTTNEGGEFLMDAITPGAWRVLASARGWRFEQAIDARTDDGQLLIQGVRMPRVRGRVVRDRTGEPLSSFTLAHRTTYWAGSNTQRVSESDHRFEQVVDGRFELFDLHPARESEYVIEVGTSDGAPSFSAAFRFGGDDVEGLEVRVRDGGSIRGRVVDADGRPLFGALVRACTSTPGLEQRFVGFERDELYRRRATRTDESGEFLLEHLGPAPHTLLVDAADHLPCELPNVLVSDDHTNAIGDVVLRRGALVRGRALDRTCCETPRVFLDPLDGSGRARIETICDARGRFEFRVVPPGRYRLRAVCLGAIRKAGQDASAGRILELEEGEALLDVVVEVDP